MNDAPRDPLRRRFERALHAIDGLRTTTLTERRLEPVRVIGPGMRFRPVRRSVRPIRSWERLVRI